MSFGDWLKSKGFNKMVFKVISPTDKPMVEWSHYSTYVFALVRGDHFEVYTQEKYIKSIHDIGSLFVELSYGLMLKEEWKKLQ